MSHSDLIYSNRLVVACLIKYQVIIKSIFELSWLYIRYANMCVQEDTGSTGCKAGGQCQEGEERGAESWDSGTSSVEGSGIESWVSADHHWEVKMVLESTRVFCGGSA